MQIFSAAVKTRAERVTVFGLGCGCSLGCGFYAGAAYTCCVNTSVFVLIQFFLNSRKIKAKCFASRYSDNTDIKDTE